MAIHRTTMFSPQPLGRGIQIAAIFAAGLLLGCNLGETRTGTATDAEQQSLAESQLANVPPALTKSEWVVRTRQPDGEEPNPRWRHPALEELLEMPADSRPGLVALLENSDPLVKANTAIGLTRLGLGDATNVVAVLVSAVETPLKNLPPTQRMPLRRAAAEALGNTPGVEAGEAVKDLLAQFGDHQDDNRAKYEAELHAELILAMQASGNELSAEQGLAALASPDRTVRSRVLRVWPTEVGSSLPQEVVDVCQDDDPELRSEAILLLARSQHPEALASARRALGDSDLSVQLAAIEAIGLAGGDGAAESLQELLSKRKSERIRAAAVVALTEMGSRQVAFAAVDAENWRVRLAIAETLADDPSNGAPEVARRLLDDPSQEVTKALLESLSQWPLVDCAPLLLDAMASDQFGTRKAATEALSERWPAARQFSYQAPPALREEVLEKLRQQWQESAQAEVREQEKSTARVVRSKSQSKQKDVEHYLKMLDSPHPSAELKKRYYESLVAMGDDLVEAMEHYAVRQRRPIADDIYTKVLPEVDATFADLQRLGSDNKNDRRNAAKAIAASTKSGGLSRLALQRLSQLMIRQDDPLVWRAIQQAVASEEDLAVVAMQTAGLTHDSAEVRRRACDYFALHQDTAPTDALLATLDDQDTSVVYSALKAIGAQSDVTNALPIVRLTASNDKTVRVAAAVTLVHLGMREGSDALERLALDADTNIRRIAAESMGETGDERFIPILIGMLDDQLGVRRAALGSLADVAGEDIGRSEDSEAPNTDQQIHRWRKWHLLRGIE